MTPFLLFLYLLAVAGGLLFIGLVFLFLVFVFFAAIGGKPASSSSSPPATGN